MIRFVLLVSLVLFYAFPLFGMNTTYIEDDEVLLEGVFISAYADPSNTTDGKTHEYPAIKLNKPINFKCRKEDEYCASVDNVLVMQLSMDQKQMSQFKIMKGKNVVIKGKLFHSDTGHHFTSVLVMVAKIL